MTIDLTRDEILVPESITAAERENSMRTFMRSAKRSLAAAVAALAAIFLTGARAESLQIEGGQIADAAPDASGIRVFKGIPYAAPPVEELRWKAPQPVPPWDGIRSIVEWGPRCVQSSRLGDLDPLNKRMDEDCLYLNVWTSTTSSSQLLPVMVWIHGGSNLNGAGSPVRALWSSPSITGSTFSASWHTRN